MKKIILTIFSIVLVLLLAGCNSWKSKFGVSDLEVKDDYIVGKIKNKTNFAYDLDIKVILKNGSLTEEKNCNMFLKPQETKNINCISVGYNGYKVKVKKIEFEQKEVPKLKNGEINYETLKYNFSNIYEEHTDNFISFTLLNDDFEAAYPYIDEIQYDKKEEIVKITGTMGNIDCIVSYGEKYNAKTEKLETAYFLIKTKDDKLRDELLTKISLLSSFEYKNAVQIRRALTKEETGLGWCYEVGNDWCVSSKIEKDEDSYFYTIDRQ